MYVKDFYENSYAFIKHKFTFTYIVTLLNTKIVMLYSAHKSGHFNQLCDLLYFLILTAFKTPGFTINIF
jgi:hypothetical protein